MTMRDRTWIVDKPIAHRGLHSGCEVPENSLAAFHRSLDMGFPIELDVHILASSEVVVFHDDNLKRLTGFNGLIWEQDFATISKLRLYGTQQTIPTLQEVFELVDGGVPILIEVKNVQTIGGLENELNDIISQYSGPVAVQSFNPLSLKWFKLNAPHVLRGQLSGDLRDERLKKLCFNDESEPDFIAYDYRHIPNEWVSREIFKRHIPLLAWTVRSQHDAELALKTADNIIFEGFLPSSNEP